LFGQNHSITFRIFPTFVFSCTSLQALIQYKKPEATQTQSLIQYKKPEATQTQSLIQYKKTEATQTQFPRNAI